MPLSHGQRAAGVSRRRRCWGCWRPNTFWQFPEWSEGQLSKGRARIVNAGSLEAAARRCGLANISGWDAAKKKLAAGRSKRCWRTRSKPLSQGFILMRVWAQRGRYWRQVLFEQALEERGGRIADSDRKSALQEFFAGTRASSCGISPDRESGPDHQKLFLMEVWVDGERMAEGEGGTKKEAEQRAASSALEKLEHAEARG